MLEEQQLEPSADQTHDERGEDPPTEAQHRHAISVTALGSSIRPAMHPRGRALLRLQIWPDILSRRAMSTGASPPSGLAVNFHHGLPGRYGNRLLAVALARTIADSAAMCS